MRVENIHDLIPLEPEPPKPEAPAQPSEWAAFIRDHFGPISQLWMQGYGLREATEFEVRNELAVRSPRTLECEVCRRVVWQNLKRAGVEISEAVQREIDNGWNMTTQRFWDRIFAENHLPRAVLPDGALKEGRARVGV